MRKGDVAIYLGTSGWSYPEWRGSFYPEKFPTKKMLAYYAERFGAVEVNNTFYRMPKAELLEGWAATTPPSFRFVPKAPQQITHRQKLAGSAETVAHYAKVLAVIAERLGPTLFQLPPFMRKDVPLLTDFLAALPAGARAAFEFRHASWFSDDVFAALAQGGAALCLAESEDLATPVVRTASFGYLRLRRQDYDDAALRAWAERVSGELAPHWSETYVFFKHEDEGRGPALAARLGELLGVPAGPGGQSPDQAASVPQPPPLPSEAPEPQN